MQSYIRITCKGSDFLPVESIEEFQGNFKKRNKKEIEQIIISILKFGFSFPFFIWHHDGHYWCLDGHGRIKAFEDAGLHFYNEMILATQVASKALAVAEGFVKSRKIGKIHQNILVFIKGDPAKAALKCIIDRQELVNALYDVEKTESEELSA